MFGNLFKPKHSVGKVGEKLPEKHGGLPDSMLPQGLCPRCQKQSSFDVIGSQAVTFDSDSNIAERDGSTDKNFNRTTRFGRMAKGVPDAPVGPPRSIRCVGRGPASVGAVKTR